MTKSFVSPYGITLKENGNLEIIPVVKVEFLSKEGDWLSLFLIIDSGATISALPKSDAISFGIDIYKGKQIVISGISGEKLTGWQHQISARLGNEIFQLPVIFLDRDITPRVLGRAGIFEYFLLIFEESHKRTGFVKENQKEARIIQKILNRFGSEIGSEK